jgi:hypothetical protein
MTNLPALKLKSLVNFPANAFGGTGISVTKQSGAFYVNIDYSRFVPVSNLPSGDVPNLYTLLWNALTGIYELAPLSLVGQLSTFGNTVLVTAAGPVTVGPNDGIIAIKKTAPAPTQVNLPLAINKQGPVRVTDTAMNASTNNITILPSGTETINGLPQWTLAGDGSGITLFPLPGIGWTT